MQNLKKAYRLLVPFQFNFFFSLNLNTNEAVFNTNFDNVHKYATYYHIEYMELLQGVLGEKVTIESLKLDSLDTSLMKNFEKICLVNKSCVQDCFSQKLLKLLKLDYYGNSSYLVVQYGALS
jgi:hypothetical protein